MRRQQQNNVTTFGQGQLGEGEGRTAQEGQAGQADRQHSQAEAAQTAQAFQGDAAGQAQIPRRQTLPQAINVQIN